MLSSRTWHRFFPEIGPASVMVGNLVSGKRIAQASGRDLGQIEDNDQARKVRAAHMCVVDALLQDVSQWHRGGWVTFPQLAGLASGKPCPVPVP